MKKSLLLLSLFFSMSILGGCGGQPKTTVEETEPTLTILTTIGPIYSHTLHIVTGVSGVSVENLIDPGLDVHLRQAKPSDLIKIEEADLVIMNGLGLEEFVEDRLLAQAARGSNVIAVSGFGEEGEVHEEDEHEDEHGDEDEHAEDLHDDYAHEKYVDPHTRLNPKNVASHVEQIRDAIIKLDPTNALTYRENAANYIALLVRLDKTIQEELSVIYTGVNFLVTHDAYDYFFEAYGLSDYKAGVLAQFHGEGVSLRNLTEIAETIEKANASIVIADALAPTKLIESLQTEKDIPVAVADPIGTGLGRDVYLNNMIHISQVIAHAIMSQQIVPDTQE